MILSNRIQTPAQNSLTPRAVLLDRPHNAVFFIFSAIFLGFHRNKNNNNKPRSHNRDDNKHTHSPHTRDYAIGLIAQLTTVRVRAL